MRTNRKLVGAAAFSLALAGGGIAGAMLGTPTTSLAQDDDATEDTATGQGLGPRFGHHEPGERLETVAELLGMSAEDLRAALADGQSIAEVAEAQGVDVQVVIDALVAQATERLEEIEAALPDRITDMVNREDWGQRGPGPGQGHGPGGRFGPGAGPGPAGEVDAEAS